MSTPREASLCNMSSTTPILEARTTDVFELEGLRLGDFPDAHPDVSLDRDGILSNATPPWTGPLAEARLNVDVRANVDARFNHELRPELLRLGSRLLPSVRMLTVPRVLGRKARASWWPTASAVHSLGHFAAGSDEGPIFQNEPMIFAHGSHRGRAFTSASAIMTTEQSCSERFRSQGMIGMPSNRSPQRSSGHSPCRSSKMEPPAVGLVSCTRMRHPVRLVHRRAQLRIAFADRKYPREKNTSSAAIRPHTLPAR